jgi:hypothetical protein
VLSRHPERFVEAEPVERENIQDFAGVVISTGVGFMSVFPAFEAHK